MHKKIAELRGTARPLRTEDKVRALVTDLNDQVRAWWRSSIGPQIHVGLVDVDEIVEQWRKDRAEIEQPPAPAVEPAPARRRRWRFRAGRRG